MKLTGQKNLKFTLIEMLVVVSIILILICMLMPQLQKAIGMSRQTACVNNLRQISIGTMMYLDDYNGIYFRGNSPVGWWKISSPLVSYLGYSDMDTLQYYRWNAQTVLNCPSSPYDSPESGGGSSYCDYAANKDFIRSSLPHRRITQIKNPSEKLLFFDYKKLGKASNGGYWALVEGWEFRAGNINHEYIWTGRHDGMFNILWVDNHIDNRLMGDVELNYKKNFYYQY